MVEHENGRESKDINDFIELLHIIRYVENNVYLQIALNLSSQSTDWIVKIRNFLPEFESVFHQYHLFA